MSLIKITQKKTKDENQRNVIFPLDNRHFITDSLSVTALFFLRLNLTLGLELRQGGYVYEEIRVWFNAFAIIRSK